MYYYNNVSSCLFQYTDSIPVRTPDPFRIRPCHEDSLGSAPAHQHLRRTPTRQVVSSRSRYTRTLCWQLESATMSFCASLTLL